MRFTSFALVAVALFLAGCQPGKPAAGPPVVARWRFHGLAWLATQTNAPQLHDVLNIPEIAAVKPRGLSNVAEQLVVRLTSATNLALAAQLQPLVQAVLRNESAGEVTAEGWSLALQLPAAETAAVQASVLALPRSTGPGGAAPVTQVTNGWLLAGSTAAWLGRAAQLPALPADGLLDGEFDLPVIGRLDPRHWPRARIHLMTTNGLVRTLAQLSFTAAPLGELPAWKVPDDYMRDPIIRFTAARGLEPLLHDNEWFRVLGGGTAPDQISSWSQPDVSVRTWFAAPVEDGMARIAKIQEGLKGRVSTNAPKSDYNGVLIVNSNKSAVAVYNSKGVKGLLPSIGVVRQGTQDYLLTSMIHPASGTNRVPSELLAELTNPTVVYYDWEITAAAVPNWNVLFQYNNLSRGLRANALLPRAHYWMLAAAPKLGNSVTSIRRVTPTEFELTRNSGSGLTALELVLLTRWMDGPTEIIRGAPLPGLPRGPR